MLHLVSGLYNAIFNEVEYNLLILGHESVGKSTLLEQLKYMYHPNNVATASSSGAAVGGAAGEKGKALPPGTPLPAPPSYMGGKRIRPTVGMNYARLGHRCTPLSVTVDVLPRPEKLVPSLAPAPETHPSLELSSSQPPVSTTTRLVFWDLGGQPSLRPLWKNYFRQCQAILYVIDSTLYHKALLAKKGPGVRADVNGGAIDAALARDAYAADRSTLGSLLLTPDLDGVPFLILCNKSDVEGRLTLAQIQDALDLAGLAAQTEFYDGVDAPGDGQQQHQAVADGVDDGGCGFGNKILRLAAVSSLNGSGVAAAMDWLVLRLLHGARTVDRDGS